jgi:glycosyltransferase involved in cell wall biosynthesis
MACEVPVIATNVGGLPEVVEHGVDGYLFTPREVEIGARYALEILSLPDRGRAMGQMARVNARKKYCSKDVIPMYEAYYRRVIGDTGTPNV